jgi:hypothetical protein
VSLLWNCFGGYDYVMSMTGNLEYFQMMGFGPTEVAYVAAMPAWAKGLWAIGVWASVLGSLLLLLRSRLAATAFLVSLVGALGSFVYQLMDAGKPASMAGGTAVIMPIVIMILIVAQWYYAKRQAAAGVLR